MAAWIRGSGLRFAIALWVMCTIVLGLSGGVLRHGLALAEPAHDVAHTVSNMTGHGHSHDIDGGAEALSHSHQAADHSHIAYGTISTFELTGPPGTKGWRAPILSALSPNAARGPDRPPKPIGRV
jgi:hypothetical protein